jgi:hypothetical protein
MWRFNIKHLAKEIKLRLKGWLKVTMKSSTQPMSGISLMGVCVCVRERETERQRERERKRETDRIWVIKDKFRYQNGYGENCSIINRKR